MIPILFAGDATTFTGAGLGALPDCTFCEVTEERNGIFECEFKYPVNGQMFRQIKPGCIVYVPYDVSGTKEPFDIYGYSVDITGMATFRARHFSYRLNTIMWDHTYRMSGRLNNTSGGILAYFNGSLTGQMNKLRYGTPSFTGSGYSSSVAEQPMVDIKPQKMMSLRELLLGGEESLVGQTGAELKWNALQCTVYRRRGNDTTAVIRVGHNLSGLTYEYDVSDVRDAFIPYWKDQDSIYYMDTLPSDATSYPSDAIGAPCVYDHVYTYGDYFSAFPLDVTSVFPAEYETEGKPTADKVYNYASNEYNVQSIGKPYENLSIDFRPLWQSAEYSQNISPAEKLKLCDTAQVAIPELGVNKRMKVCKTVWDVLQNRYTRLEFGTTQRTIYTVNYDSGTAEETEEGTVIIVDEDVEE